MEDGGNETHLCLGVVLLLLGAAQDRPSLVSVAQITRVVANDTSRARVDKSLDVCLLAGFNDGLCAVDVDLEEELLGDGGVVGHGGCGVDDDVGGELDEEFGQLVVIGDVAFVVRGLVAAVLGAAQIDGGDARGGP